jgi:hypothetical protein
VQQQKRRFGVQAKAAADAELGPDRHFHWYGLDPCDFHARKFISGMLKESFALPSGQGIALPHNAAA